MLLFIYVSQSDKSRKCVILSVLEVIDKCKVKKNVLLLYGARIRLIVRLANREMCLSIRNIDSLRAID